jgi:hypothetical protein
MPEQMTFQEHLHLAWSIAEWGSVYEHLVAMGDSVYDTEPVLEHIENEMQDLIQRWSGEAVLTREDGLAGLARAREYVTLYLDQAQAWFGKD